MLNMTNMLTSRQTFRVELTRKPTINEGQNIRRRQADMERSRLWAVRIYAVTCIAATAIWIKVLFQALSMIGGK